jgi:ferredoxin
VGTAERIAKLGFRRWYERQLIEGHLYLVSCFLCMILVVACLEELSFRDPGLRHLLMMGLSLGGGWVGIFSWGRYRTIVARAERLGDQSTCAGCKTYGSLQVTASGPVSALDYARDRERAEMWIRVRCRKCGHEWCIQ